MRSPRHNGTTYGFSRAVTLMQSRIRKASEGRGFSESRLLTHWAEIVGEDTAKVSNPVDIKYSRGGMGATLTLLTTGASAPMLEMQKEQIRKKVNRCYGYNAISRVRITQSAPTGFADGKVAFQHAPKAAKAPDREAEGRAREATTGVESEELRQALERLGANVISKDKTHKR
ncbi:hypothetical protein SAMN05444003_2479 [Cognatiyoonia sediminum]|uniref:RNA-binding protein n=1 Tax=Cognatiyoonia sediminum TaxID=1508389 RepID=A0A1M5RBD8_9RHOB|nr:DciA family protein [Cognatiyoonia sediminum]SHH23379.1 hypothetical protein SAMN05444003_2479 [Cognatiyoonia sediminum]